MVREMKMGRMEGIVLDEEGGNVVRKDIVELVCIEIVMVWECGLNGVDNVEGSL